MMSRIDLRMRKKKNIELNAIGQELLQSSQPQSCDSMSTYVTPRRSGRKMTEQYGVAHSTSKPFKLIPSFALCTVYRLPGSGYSTPPTRCVGLRPGNVICYLSLITLTCSMQPGWTIFSTTGCLKKKASASRYSYHSPVYSGSAVHLTAARSSPR